MPILENHPGMDLPEELEVLKSIYPELQLHHADKNISITLPIPIQPETHLTLRLTDADNDGRVIKEESSNHVSELSFYAEYPITSSNFVVFSSWVCQETLRGIKSNIQQIIKRCSEDGMFDSTLYEVCDYLAAELCSTSEKVKELCQGYEITTTSQSQFDTISQMFIKAKLDHFEASRFFCSICLENKNGFDGVIIPHCEHTFCKECFAEYADNVINNDDVLKLQCPDCPIETFDGMQKLSRSQLTSLLFGRKFPQAVLEHAGVSKDTIDKYKNLMTTSIYDKLGHNFPFSVSQCPRCQIWILRDDIDDKLVQCRQCDYNYCFECLHSWHGEFNSCGKKFNSVPLHVIEEILEDESVRAKYESQYGRKALKFHIDEYLADQEFKEYLERNEDVVNCPACEAAISKIDGCNKMTCTMCKRHFCYLCLTLLDKDDPYRHYTTEDGSKCKGRLFEGLIGAD